MRVLTSSSVLGAAALVVLLPLACGTPFTSSGDTSATTSTGGGATSTATTTTTSTGVGGTGAGGQTTSTGSGGAGGKPPGCTLPSDCEGVDTQCTSRTCIQGTCGVMMPMGPIASQIYGDCKAMACDGQGHLIEAPLVTDVYDDGNVCTLDGCNGGAPVNKPNQGAICGSGVCSGKGACVQCLDGGSCPVLKKNCVNGTCLPDYCNDTFQDFNETATDCGGPTCLPCDDGATCGTSLDCKSQICNGDNGDPQTCKPATCGDSKKNGNETDEDCGGDCADLGKRCQPGQHCARPGDCGSRVCVAGVCLAPTCVDGVKNGGETGPDCGGNGCGPCLPPG